MAPWKFEKGLHEIGDGCWAYLQPDGSWGFSNAGLVTDGAAERASFGKHLARGG